MRFTVTFSVLAHHQLGEIWLRARDRQLVTDAADHMESLLRENAYQRGQQRTNDWRVIVVGPLATTFEVDLDDRRVTVLSIRYNTDLGKR